MLAFSDVSTLDSVDQPNPCTNERSLEAKVLMRAVNALRLAGVLTADEYEAKRERLAARL